MNEDEARKIAEGFLHDHNQDGCRYIFDRSHRSKRTPSEFFMVFDISRDPSQDKLNGTVVVVVNELSRQAKFLR